MKPKEAFNHPWITRSDLSVMKSVMETRSSSKKTTSADRKLTTLHYKKSLKNSSKSSLLLTQPSPSLRHPTRHWPNPQI
ncbi:hypothetical protein HMI55_004342 [Coelomomyces lativittatus]|nr:hypothetical protein HMI55_004342 [Coelomomyces lativittatus]